MTTETTLTILEEDVMNAIRENDFYDYEGTPIWSESLHDSCQTCTKSQISGVVSSLVKKDMVKVTNTSTRDATVEYTEEGLKLYGWD